MAVVDLMVKLVAALEIVEVVLVVELVEIAEIAVVMEVVNMVKREVFFVAKAFSNLDVLVLVLEVA